MATIRGWKNSKPIRDIVGGNIMSEELEVFYDLDKENRRQTVKGILVLVAFVGFTAGLFFATYMLVDNLTTTVNTHFGITDETIPSR